MGVWVLESFKMAVYVLFPVLTFYTLNQPIIFDNWVKQEHPPKSPEALKYLELYERKVLEKKMQKAKEEITLL